MWKLLSFLALAAFSTIPTVTAQTSNDVSILEKAYHYHELQASYYGLYLKQYTVDNFTASNYSTVVYSNIQAIKLQEQQAADTINSTYIQLNASTPISQRCYDFSSTSAGTGIPSFLATAYNISNAVVSVYASVINQAACGASADTRNLLTRLLILESEHFSYLSVQSKPQDIPFTFYNATQLNSLSAQGNSTISQYQVSCPSQPPASAAPNTSTPASDPATTAPASAAPASGTTHQVSIPVGATGKGAAAYGVNPLVVKVGDTVVWTNNDNAPHDVTSTGNGAKLLTSGTLNNGKTYSMTFPTAGNFPYYCQIHGLNSMSGAVQVNP